MVLTRKHVPLVTTKRAGSVTWENEFKSAINDILDQAISFEDLEGFIRGLDLAYVSTTQITISPGICIPDTADTQITNSTTLTLDITTSGVNGLDTGTVADGWYYVWVVKNPTTGDVKGLLSLSDTSPTLPSGYTKKRILGAVRYTSGILNFYQQTTGSSREFMYDTGRTGIAGANSSANVWTNLDISAYVPTSSRSQWAYIMAGCRTAANETGSTTRETRVRPGSTTGTTGMIFSLVRTITGDSNGDSCAFHWVKTSASGIIQYQKDSTITRVDIDVLGYRMEI